MSEQTPDVPDVVPLYVAYDSTSSMNGGPRQAANQLLGALVAAVTGSPEASRSVWLCIAALDGTATVQLPFADVDAAVTIPPVMVGQVPAMDGAALLSLRGNVDLDWEQLRADGMPRHRPLLVLITPGTPAAAVPGWVSALHDPVHTIDDAATGARVWPPQLIVVGLGSVAEQDLRPLAAGEDDVVELATDHATLTRAEEVLTDLLLDRVFVAGDRLLRRWALAEHELGRLAPIGLRGNREVLLTQLRDLDDSRGPMRFLRYDTPRRWGDAARGVLRATALQESDLPGLLQQAKVKATWPLRLVLADDDVGTVVGVLEREIPPSAIPCRAVPLAELTCGSSPTGPKQVDPLLTPMQNSALLAVRACRLLAALIAILHGRRVVLGEALESVQVDVDELDLVIDHLDLAQVVRPGEEDGDPLAIADQRRFAEVVDRALGPQAAGDPGVLDSYGAGLLQQARLDDDHLPPSPQVWADYLDMLADRLIGLPRLLSLDVAPTIVPVGEKVLLLWRTHFVETLSIHLPDGQVIPVPPADLAQGTTEVRLATRGPIGLEAGNRLGTVRQAFPWVHLFEPVDLLRQTGTGVHNPLQVVTLPPLPALPQPSGAGDMPAYPQILAHTPAVEAGLDALRQTSDAQQALLMTSSDEARAMAVDPLLPDPLDPVRWFSTPPALDSPDPSRGRSGRRKG